MLLAAALADAGIAYGPTFVFGEHLRRGELVALLPAYRAADLTIQAVFPSAQRVPLKVRRFVDSSPKRSAMKPPWDRKQMPLKSGRFGFESGHSGELSRSGR